MFVELANAMKVIGVQRANVVDKTWAKKIIGRIVWLQVLLIYAVIEESVSAENANAIKQRSHMCVLNKSS